MRMLMLRQGEWREKNRGAADHYFPVSGNCLIGNLNTSFLPAILRLFSLAFNDTPAGRDCNISVKVSIGPVFPPATISSQTPTDIASYQAQEGFSSALQVTGFPSNLEDRRHSKLESANSFSRVSTRDRSDILYLVYSIFIPCTPLAKKTPKPLVRGNDSDRAAKVKRISRPRGSIAFTPALLAVNVRAR